MNLRRRVLELMLVLLVAPLRAELPPLLEDALKNALRDRDRWAYTEAKVMRDAEGAIKSSSLVRFDPSQPYALQYTPIEIDGRPPSDRDVEKYRKLGERRASRGIHGDDERAGRIGQKLSNVIDPDQVTVVTEDATTRTYELGLRKSGNFQLPPEKFQVLVRIDKDHRTLEHIAVLLRSSFRVRLVLKAKSGAYGADFANPEPRFGTVLTAFHVDGKASILFVPFDLNEDVTRDGYKHVTPIDERFEVKIGPLKALDF